MELFIGLDAHSSSSTFAVIGPSGRRLKSDVVETNAKALVEYVRLIPGDRYLCTEEGTLSTWLYEVLSPHVRAVVVAGIGESRRGQKSDTRDAFGLAERLRNGAIEKRVYKEVGPFGKLRELVKVHDKVVRDSVRAQNRLKNLVKESRKHPIAKVLKTCPGMGPIRVAQLVAVVVSPHRFRTKRQFWSYCGLGIVMRSSSDYVQVEDRWVRAPVIQTRGLSRSHNWMLKRVFKGAATSVIGLDNPFNKDYERLLVGSLP